MTSWTPGPVPVLSSAEIKSLRRQLSASPAPVREVFYVRSATGRDIGFTDDYDTAASFFASGYVVS